APIYDKDLYEGNDVAGVVTGLAWTQVGGDILFIEASLSPGKGRLTMTGSLGDVMKESTSIALAYLRAHAKDFDIDPKLFDQWDIHVHVPAALHQRMVLQLVLLCLPRLLRHLRNDG